jgi:hypothetical protein
MAQLKLAEVRARHMAAMGLGAALKRRFGVDFIMKTRGGRVVIEAPLGLGGLPLLSAPHVQWYLRGVFDNAGVVEDGNVQYFV